MRTIILLFISVFYINSAFADQVRIYGQNESYAKSKIEIKYHTDVFTYSEKTITEFEVDAEGKFSVNIDITETKLVFFPLGIYKAFLYVEPGKEYEIKLPPKRDLTPVQKLNPFFEKEELLIGVANTKSSDLNILIRKLDDKIDPFINQNFHKIYRKKEKSVGIEFSKELIEDFKSNENAFLKEYLKYRLGFLEFLAYPNSFLKIEEKYFLDQELQLKNPAYVSLYKKQYGNFLNGYFKQKESANLSAAFKSETTFKALTALMKKYPAYQNSQLRNMIIASSIFDSYTRKFISKGKTLSILKDLKQNTQNSYNKNLSSNYIAKITHLQKNYPAPNFTIGDHSLANYKGKYLYLNFCNTQSYPCVQDFKEIEKLKQQFGQHIEFLSIACNWNENTVLDFLQKNAYSWPIVPIGDQHQLIHQYKVKAFPSYVLIDPSGNIAKAPAAGPKENIRMEFIKIARDAARKSYNKQ